MDLLNYDGWKIIFELISFDDINQIKEVCKFFNNIYVDLLKSERYWGILCDQNYSADIEEFYREPELESDLADRLWDRVGDPFRFEGIAPPPKLTNKYTFNLFHRLSKIRICSKLSGSIRDLYRGVALTLHNLPLELQTIPSGLYLLPQLISLSLSYLSKDCVIDEISRISKLYYLSINYSNITQLPKNLGDCGQLWKIVLNNNCITSIPESISKCLRLRHLYIQNSQSRTLNIPSSIIICTDLKTLRLKRNNIETMAYSFPSRLMHLSYQGNRITYIPTAFCTNNIRHLNLNKNYLTHIPDEIVNMTHLRVLSINFNKLTVLPNDIGLMNLAELDISRNFLTNIPNSIAKMTSLRVLNIRANQLISLPILNNPNLMHLNVSNNKLTELDDNFIGVSDTQDPDWGRNTMNFVNNRLSEKARSKLNHRHVKFQQGNNKILIVIKFNIFVLRSRTCQRVKYGDHRQLFTIKKLIQTYFNHQVFSI